MSVKRSGLGRNLSALLQTSETVLLRERDIEPEQRSGFS